MAEGRKPSYSVWIEAENWEPGSWVATCFTYKNILSLAAKNRLTGECLHGQYFWAPSMVMVDVVSRERLEQLIADWIRTDEFEQIFTRLA